jgi:hypothetical protein
VNDDMKAAEVSATEEADWLQCLLNSLMAAHRPEDTKRFGLGRYTLDEASLLLSLSLSETGAFNSQLRDHMWAAVERSELRLRDEVTGLFVGEKHLRNGWGVVTRQDVNAWLEVNEVGYRWEEPSAPTSGSETPETKPTAEAESAADAPPVAPSGATETVTANEPKNWLDIALPYIVGMLKSKNFGTAKELFRALEADADSPTSPFSKVVGLRRGDLHLRKPSQSIALKTFQNRWGEIRAAANLH